MFLFSGVKVLESYDTMVTFTPRGKAPYRPELKIVGIGVPITLECFVMTHHDPKVTYAQAIQSTPQQVRHRRTMTCAARDRFIMHMPSGSPTR
jgi:hypothetical protein